MTVRVQACSSSFRKRSSLLSRTTDLPLDGDPSGSPDLWVSADLGLLSVVLVLVSSLLGSSVDTELAVPSLQDVSLDRSLSPCPSSLDVTGLFSLALDLVLDGLSRLELLSSGRTSLALDAEPPSLLDLSPETSCVSLVDLSLDLDLAVLSLADFLLELDRVLVLPLPLLASSVLSSSPLKLLLRELDSSWYLLADVTRLRREAGALLVLLWTSGRTGRVSYSHEGLVLSRERDFDQVVVDPQSVGRVVMNEFLSLQRFFHFYKSLRRRRRRRRSGVEDRFWNPDRSTLTLDGRNSVYSGNPKRLTMLSRSDLPSSPEGAGLKLTTREL